MLVVWPMPVSTTYRSLYVGCVVFAVLLVGYAAFSREAYYNAAHHISSVVQHMRNGRLDDGFPITKLQHCSMEERTRRIRDTCGRTTPLGLIDLNLLNRGQMIVDERRRYLYCAIAKAGSSTVKRLMVKLSGFQPKPGAVIRVHGSNINRYNGLKSLNKYPPSQQQSILRTYFKIIAVRNPFDRLVSAYKDKFVKLQMLPRLVKSIKDRFRAMSGDRKSPVTFRELITHFSDSFKESQNGHWNTYESLCQPCVVKYDYVIKLETADEDFGRLVELLTAAQSNVSVEAENKSNGRLPPRMVSNLTEYTSIPREIVKKVYDIYRKDFELFGYNYSFDTHTGTCKAGDCC